MMLEGKIAVIYGAAGEIGRVTAKTFAKEGAAVFLAGRTLDTLNSVKNEIVKAGGFADASQVDALDQKSVSKHLDMILSTKGKLDISYNLISTSVGIGSQLTQLSPERFTETAFTRAKSCFITSTAAARIMEKQGYGVILGISARVGRLPEPGIGGFPVGNAAVEALLKQLAMESGPKGVRVVCLRTGGTPESAVLQEVYTKLAQVRGTTKEAVEKEEARITALKRSPRILEVANTAVLLASDYASAITATPVNASCGELVD